MSSIYVYAIGWVTEWARRCSYYPKDCVWSTSLSWKNSQKGRLNNKWSKNLDGRSQRHLVTSRGNKWIRLTLTPLDPYEPAPKRHLDRFSRFCVHRSKSSQYFSMGQTNPKNRLFPLRDWHPDLYVIQIPKRHLNWFSRFCRAHEYDQPTGRLTTLFRL